jgi:hypothetical protein
MEQKQPNWNQILKEKEEKISAFILGDFPTDISHKKIRKIDYKRFSDKFEHPLTVRKIDYKKNPLFSITFAEFEDSTEGWKKIDKIMKDDFRDVIITKE